MKTRIWTMLMVCLATGAMIWQPPALVAAPDEEGPCQETTCTRSLDCNDVWDPVIQAYIDCPECNGDFANPGTCWLDN
jgi:hypothetical protein